MVLFGMIVHSIYFTIGFLMTKIMTWPTITKEHSLVPTSRSSCYSHLSRCVSNESLMYVISVVNCIFPF